MGVMILADVFESFRNTTLHKYKLDPAHFMTAPSLSWSACLKKTKVKLELLTDPDMSMFIDKSLLGGISAVLIPYARANNPQCPDYNPELPLNTIMYVDANNLYTVMYEFHYSYIAKKFKDCKLLFTDTY